MRAAIRGYQRVIRRSRHTKRLRQNAASTISLFPTNSPILASYRKPVFADAIADRLLGEAELSGCVTLVSAGSLERLSHHPALDFIDRGVQGSTPCGA